MKQVYPDQLNPVYLSYKYLDWYRNGMNTRTISAHLEVGFKAQWSWTKLCKLRKPDGLNLHMVIL